MTVSVSQLNKYVSFVLKEDSNIQNIKVRGEISNFVRNSNSGHCYFTLKDAGASVRAVMFNSYAHNLRFAVENGMSVVVSASASLYERDGAFQLYVTGIENDGSGNLLAQFEKLKEKLSSEGVFDEAHKRTLPKFPKRIGVVASKEGAALQDVINILSRRYPLGELAVIPAIVQGENAPQSVCRAIVTAHKINCDVLIIARGGGSFEDLNCFNDESLVGAVYACSMPVISAIGHETDFTLCDFAADLRAPTPSAAAELVSCDKDSISDSIYMLNCALEGAISKKLTAGSDRLKHLENMLALHSVEAKLQRGEKSLELLNMRLSEAMRRKFEDSENSFIKTFCLLENLNPMQVLTRGFAVVSDENGRIITSSDETCVGSRIDIRLSKGKISATVDLCE